MPERGDVVVFTHPSYPDRFLIKRVLGLPGERITVSSGHIHADGVVIADPWGDGRVCQNIGDAVRTDEVWLLGDNRCGASVDSRVLGPVPIEDIGWKVVARYWPPTRAGRI